MTASGKTRREMYRIINELWSAEVEPHLGANVTRLQYKSQDVFVPLLSRGQLEKNPYIQGAPILLPANRTANGQFTFEGREYTLPINEPANKAHLHGLLHTCRFNTDEISEDSITLSYKNEGEIYPFPFEITVKYSIVGEAFKQSYTVKNTGKGNMPFTFALHTSFVEPESFTVPIDMCQEKDERHIPTGRYIKLSERESRYAKGSPSKGIPISRYYRSCGHTAFVGEFNYTVSDDFDHWILFNAAGKGNLLCVEPQCGAVNGLNMEKGHTVLAPGEEKTLYTLLEKANR